MKKIMCIIMVGIFLMPSLVKAEITLAENASSVIVLEHSTKEIIYERNAHEKKPMASMTKIMTMLLVMESIEKEVITWDDIVTVSLKASSMGGSQILLEANEKMSVYDLFKGLSIASGNDAAVALAEYIAGSEEAFVNMMNDKVFELGLLNTNFKNSHGLDEVNHFSTAYDMAIIANELMKHEKVTEFTSIYEDYLRKDTDRAFWLVNTNKLVRFYDGVDGLKTGYTNEALYCLTATAYKNDMRIIAVVMGEPDSKTRDAEVSSIFDYVYAQYGLNLVASKDTVIETVNVDKGKKEVVEIVPIKDVTDLYLKTNGKNEVTYDVLLDDLKAPIKVGDIVGTMLIKENGNEISKVDLTVKEDVLKVNILELFWRNLKEIIK